MCAILFVKQYKKETKKNRKNKHDKYLCSCRNLNRKKTYYTNNSFANKKYKKNRKPFVKVYILNKNHNQEKTLQ